MRVRTSRMSACSTKQQHVYTLFGWAALLLFAVDYPQVIRSAHPCTCTCDYTVEIGPHNIMSKPISKAYLIIWVCHNPLAIQSGVNCAVSCAHGARRQSHATVLNAVVIIHISYRDSTWKYQQCTIHTFTLHLTAGVEVEIRMGHEW